MEIRNTKVSGTPEDVELWCGGAGRGGCGHWMTLLSVHTCLRLSYQEWNIFRVPLKEKVVGIITNGACSKYVNVPLKSYFV